MTGEATPTDGRFRRGVYVMLVVIGLLAAGGLIDARRNAPELTAAKDAARAASKDAAEARRQQAEESRKAAEREARAVQQRQDADAKLDALERFTAALLAASGTPEQRRAYAVIITSPAPSGSPAPAGSPRSSPPPSPRASSSSSPRPSPSAACRVYSPVSGRCVVPA